MGSCTGGLGRRGWETTGVKVLDCCEITGVKVLGCCEIIGRGVNRSAVDEEEEIAAIRNKSKVCLTKRMRGKLRGPGERLGIS